MMDTSCRMDSNIARSCAPVVEATSALDRVRTVVTILAAPGGCPWDGKQTNRTLLKNLIEETYEYVDTVEADDREGMREELGDLLLQSVFQGVVCQKDSVDPFTLDEVCDRLVNKLITRHPAVFAPDSAQDADDGSGQSPEDVLKLWNEMKRREKHPHLRARRHLPLAGRIPARCQGRPPCRRIRPCGPSVRRVRCRDLAGRDR